MIIILDACAQITRGVQIRSRPSPLVTSSLYVFQKRKKFPPPEPPQRSYNFCRCLYSATGSEDLGIPNFSLSNLNEHYTMT